MPAVRTIRCKLAQELREAGSPQTGHIADADMATAEVVTTTTADLRPHLEAAVRGHERETMSSH